MARAQSTFADAWMLGAPVEVLRRVRPRTRWPPQPKRTWSVKIQSPQGTLLDGILSAPGPPFRLGWLLQWYTGLWFGHTPYASMRCEVSCREIAARLGPPWAAMVSPCVLREIDLPNGGVVFGVLALWADGDRSTALAAIPASQRDAAALFDRVTAQQDRTQTNYLWDAAHKRMTLIDHEFSNYVSPLGFERGRLFVQGRADRSLTPTEVDAVARLRSSQTAPIRTLSRPRRLALRIRAWRIHHQRHL